MQSSTAAPEVWKEPGRLLRLYLAYESCTKPDQGHFRGRT